ncbi:AAA family ATPase [archaeon]|jgi:adenylate kinase|nr:AAA family ATPase [archaeon]MBT6820925.1 AAA family ATPase [archaeon]
MFKVICVSGTPGTGKTTFSIKYSKDNNFYYLDVNEFIKKKELIDDFDKKRDSNIVDTEKLNFKLVEEIKRKKKEKKYKGIIIDSHLSHYLSKEVVDKVIITKCDLKKLKKRLEKRKYTIDKIRENMDAEIFDVCRIEALEEGHTVEIINTD